MNAVILGGGLAGISLAYFLKENSTILEKEERVGGLCRSFKFNNIFHDIGPHILFSRDQLLLKEMLDLIQTNTIRRSNKIFHRGRLIKYPFENDLGSLEKKERDYCLETFLNNPYEKTEAKTMLQFFLKTFGEGITDLYLKPYNEKMWKFDPAFMDIQIVERIPKPPKEDIVNSAKGIATEGYLHQLYFQYPKRDGIQALITGYKNLISGKSKIINPVIIKKIYKEKNTWHIDTDRGNFSTNRIINCMPLQELFKYIEVPQEIRNNLTELKYNSIYILIIQAKKDNMGENFAFYFADKDTIFHRLSKVNFLGENYCLDNSASTILAEITYRPNSYPGDLSKEELNEKALNSLEVLKIVNKCDIIDTDLKNFEYAYVIYDLNHRKNTNLILRYLLELGIECCGRFAEFEYLNMDQTVNHGKRLAEKLNR